MYRRHTIAVRAAVLGMAVGVAASAVGQPYDIHFKASPDVYKVRVENEQIRLVEGVWKPGQKDLMHSHPAPHLYYWLTPCSLRWHLPDGKSRDVAVAAGQAGSTPVVPAHVVENIGSNECRILMFEAKSPLG